MTARLQKVTVNGVPRVIDLLRTPAADELNGWSNVVIRGGGWVVGLDTASPTMYARTDVGGAYRYDTATSRWVQVITATGIGTGMAPLEDYQVDAIGAAPTSPNTVIATIGASSGGNLGRIIRSTDGGTSWTVGARSIYVGGNENNRWAGNRLAFDPDNASVAYLGTRKNGLLRTVDGGQTWTTLPTPATVADAAGTGAIGVNIVIPDPASPVTSGAHQTIWAAVYGVGLVRSTDGGTTWTTVHAVTGGSSIRDAVRASNGMIYAAVFNTTAASARVVRISADGGTVTTITPGTANQWTSITVDPTNPDLVIVAAAIVNVGNRIFRSSNATAANPTWTAFNTINLAGDSKGTTWPATTTDIIYSMAVGQIRIIGGVLWFAEGMGMWRTSDHATGTTLNWAHASDGIEELVGNVAHKPSGQQLLTASWDRGIFRHPKPVKQLPATGEAAYLPCTAGFGAAWDINSSTSNPTIVAAILDDSGDPLGFATRRASGYSLDGGATWTRFAALTAGTAPADLIYGNIAINPGNANNLIWIPSNLYGTGSKAYYTFDRGATWTAGTLTGISSSDLLHNNKNAARRILAADPSTPGRFLALGSNNGQGVIWSTDNSGQTWYRLATLTSNCAGDSQLIVTPTATYWYAFPGNGATGFHRSTDGGTTWTTKTNISDTYGAALGAPMTAGGNPTLYTFGTTSQGTGLHRSLDNGDTWTRVAGYPNNLYAGIRNLAADPDIPGRVYFAFGGNGYAAGQFN